MYQDSSLLKSFFCLFVFTSLFSDMLIVYIVYAIENANTVLGVKVKRKGIAPLTFELAFHSQRLLDSGVLLSSVQDAVLAAVTFEQQVS